MLCILSQLMYGTPSAFMCKAIFDMYVIVKMFSEIQTSSASMNLKLRDVLILI